MTGLRQPLPGMGRWDARCNVALFTGPRLPELRAAFPGARRTSGTGREEAGCGSRQPAGRGSITSRLNTWPSARTLSTPPSFSTIIRMLFMP